MDKSNINMIHFILLEHIFSIRGQEKGSDASCIPKKRVRTDLPSLYEFAYQLFFFTSK